MNYCKEIIFDNSRGLWICVQHQNYLALWIGAAVFLAVVIFLWRKLVAAIDDLNANIATLNTTIASAVTALGNTGVPQAAVEAAATAVAQANATLAAAIPAPPAL